MGKHVVDLLIAKDNLVYGLPSVFERGVVTIDIRRQEDLYTKWSASNWRRRRDSLYSPGFHAKPWLEER